MSRGTTLKRGEGRVGAAWEGYCWKLFWTMLIQKSLKHDHLCHVSQNVSTNFVANCGVANKPIWFFCVKLDFLLSCGKYWNFNNNYSIFVLCFDRSRFTVVEGRRERQTSSYKTNFLVSGTCLILNVIIFIIKWDWVPKVEVDNSLQDLHDSSHHRKDKLNNNIVLLFIENNLFLCS